MSHTVTPFEILRIVHSSLEVILFILFFLCFLLHIIYFLVIE